MAYYPVQIDPGVPRRVKDFVRRHVDMQFEDVHCMLRLPIPEHDLNAGCNFAAATFLLDLISGLSTVLYQQSGGSGQRFKGMLINFYPWDLEPAKGAVSVPSQGAADLYKLFRNPLAHALGMPTKDVRGAVRRTTSQPALGIAKQGMPEDLLEALERSTTQPEATIGVGSGGEKTLFVHGLYWGVRCMLGRLTVDSARMTAADQFLM